MIYFDNASTTSVDPEVVRLYGTLLQEIPGNADALHKLGRQAQSLSDRAREQIAALLHVQPDELVLTSCGSEANSLATAGFALANQNRGRHILTSNVEHSSTAHTMDWLESIGFDVERLPVNEQGIVTPEQVQAALRKDTILVSLMHVNNETGSINPIADIADVVHRHPTAVFHSDLVQSFAKEDIPMDKLDLATISAHKIHGLKGSGLLIKKHNVRLHPLTFGGQQEQGLRGGTENTPALVALAKTMRKALEQKEKNGQSVHALNQYLRKELTAMPGITIESPADASDYILNISFDAITSEVLMNALDSRDICVSAKSTCESRSGPYSEVLHAMGRDKKTAARAIRLSFSGENTLQEGRLFLHHLKEILNQYGLSL